MTVILNEENFKKEIESGVTLVDFWAEWCGPCQVMLPILDELSKKMEGKAKISKVNVDENPSLSAQFRVMSIPTILIMKDGEVVEQLVGVQQVDALETTLNKFL